MTRKLVGEPKIQQPNPRRYVIVGKHARNCDHPDFAHSFTGCAADNCECTAHYILDRSSRLGE